MNGTVLIFAFVSLPLDVGFAALVKAIYHVIIELLMQLYVLQNFRSHSGCAVWDANFYKVNQ